MKKIPGPLAVLMSGFLLGVLMCILGFAKVGGDRTYYYLLSLVIAGALAALPSPQWFLLAPFAIYAGQVVYKFIGHPVIEGYAIIGLIFGAMYALAALPGAFFTYVGWLVRRKEKET